jgi:hypothetical protein
MARKRKENEVPDQGSEAMPAEQAVTTLSPPSNNGTPEVNGPADMKNGQAPVKNRPAASFSAYSDRTTRIEVAVWAKLVKVSEQEEYTQYTLTLARSWQKDGQWQGNAAFRIHDLPVLMYLAQQAYNWCVSRRTEVRIGDEPLPF